MPEGFQDEPGVAALREELEATRASITRYRQLIEELPALYEGKFSDRIAPLLLRRQHLLEEQALLHQGLRDHPPATFESRASPQHRLAASHPAPLRPRKLPELPTLFRLILPVLTAAGVVGMIFTAGRLGQPPVVTQHPRAEPVPIPARDPGDAAGESPGRDRRTPEGDRQGKVTVKAGETLSEIAERHGVRLRHLVERNGISDPHFLEIGQHLLLP
jgi:hypothetical protein